MLNKVSISKNAQADMDEIFSYIANHLHSPRNAYLTYKRIIASIESLVNFPMRYQICKCELWRNRNIRVMPIGNHLVFYTFSVDESAIKIFRVLNSRRNIEKASKETIKF